ncbi:MAG: hypothetical protein ACLFVX_00645 [Archaeoglobaceae archaeon]
MRVCQSCYEIIEDDEPAVTCPSCQKLFHGWARCLVVKNSQKANICAKCKTRCYTHRYCPNCGALIYSLCERCL